MIEKAAGMSRDYRAKTMTGGYGGDSIRSMHGGMGGNERGYGTTSGVGTSEAAYGNEGHTKYAKEKGKTFRNRYQVQHRERYVGRSGTQLRSYHKNEEEIINEKEAGKVEVKSRVAEKSELPN